MALITLQNDTARATIDTFGAWLLDYTQGSQQILFPKQTFTLPDGSQKVRGGCHVCLPNFGPGGNSRQGQHGFARNNEWTIIERTGSQLILGLVGTDEYQGLSVRLTYELTERTLSMKLNGQNTSELPLRIAPGFHPYFPASAQSRIQVDEATYSLNECNEALFLDTEPKNLTIDQNQYAIKSDSLPQWVLWSDRLGDYICLEPTQAGFSFLGDPADSELLLPHQTKEWSFELTV